LEGADLQAVQKEGAKGKKNMQPSSKSLETKQRQADGKLHVIPEMIYTAKGIRRDLGSTHVSGVKSNSSQQRRGNSSASEKSNQSGGSTQKIIVNLF